MAAAYERAATRAAAFRQQRRSSIFAIERRDDTQEGG
jgi:hypothetical protein